MTQQQRFIEASELYFPIDSNCNYSEKLLIDIKYRREYFIEGCEYQLKKQENFAIRFAEWVLIYEDIAYDSSLSMREVLEIYKKSL